MNCIVCGRELTGAQKKFCSKKCSNANNVGKMMYWCTCAICGKKFLWKNSGKKFCSDECKAKYEPPRRERKKEEKGNSLTEDAAEARKMGMSYGKYMALKYIKNSVIIKRRFNNENNA
jgi:predicted nucleic acid-binding Zn ribbon protein